jgi:hypothetical protein
MRTFLLRDMQSGLDSVIAAFPDAPQYLAVVDGFDQRFRVPFAPRPVAAASRIGFFIGDGRSYEIKSYHWSGSLKRIIRRDHEPAQVTREHRQAHIDALRTANDGSPLVDQIMADAPWPEFFPAFTAAHTDDEGRLWICDVPEPVAVSGRESCWTIYGARGALIARVDMPDDVRVLQVGADFVLGVRFRGDLPEVGLYMIEEAGSSRTAERG